MGDGGTVLVLAGWCWWWGAKRCLDTTKMLLMFEAEKM